MSQPNENNTSQMAEEFAVEPAWGTHGPPAPGPSQPRTTTSVLGNLPHELLLAIMKSLSPQDVAKFAILNKTFYNIFKGDQTQILAAVLPRQPEFPIMIYLYTANELDRLSGGMLHPRLIKLERPHRTDTIELLHMKVPATTTYPARVVNVPHGGRPSNEYRLVPETTVGPEEIVLGGGDLIELWRQIRV